MTGSSVRKEKTVRFLSVVSELIIEAFTQDGDTDFFPYGRFEKKKNESKTSQRIKEIMTRSHITLDSFLTRAKWLTRLTRNRYQTCGRVTDILMDF